MAYKFKNAKFIGKAFTDLNNAQLIYAWCSCSTIVKLRYSIFNVIRYKLKKQILKSNILTYQLLQHEINFSWKQIDRNRNFTEIGGLWIVYWNPDLKRSVFKRSRILPYLRKVYGTRIEHFLLNWDTFCLHFVSIKKTDGLPPPPTRRTNPDFIWPSCCEPIFSDWVGRPCQPHDIANSIK